MLIKIARSDGGVSIMRTIGAPDAEVKKWEQASNLMAVSYSEIADDDVPQDRTFRDAWTPDLTVDMPKARDIHMDRIRLVRDEEMKKLDIEQLKGRDVTAEKQKLRDIPQTFDLTKAKTAAELKALWPAVLPRPR